MTDDRDAMAGAELRRRFGAADPGTASLGLRAAVAAVPSAVERQRLVGRARLALPAAGLAAAAVLAVLLSQGLGLLPSRLGAGATPGPTTVFDPTLVGPGLAAPANTSFHIAAVLILSIVLAAWAVGSSGWRRIAWLVAAAVPVAWALVGTFIPIPIGMYMYAPQAGIEAATMPAGSTEHVVYVTAGPRQPFVYGVGLSVDGDLPVRLDGVVTYASPDQPFGTMHLTAVWLDDELHGGSTGPARPFQAIDLSRDGRAIWIVGQAGPCALGHAPQPGEQISGDASLGPLQLNVSVLGWPRVVEVRDSMGLTMVEPEANGCVP